MRYKLGMPIYLTIFLAVAVVMGTVVAVVIINLIKKVEREERENAE